MDVLVVRAVGVTLVARLGRCLMLDEHEPAEIALIHKKFAPQISVLDSGGRDDRGQVVPQALFLTLLGFQARDDERFRLFAFLDLPRAVFPGYAPPRTSYRP